MGLYGVVSYATSLRTREFAIRVALGAEKSDVRRLVLGHAGRLIAASGVPDGCMPDGCIWSSATRDDSVDPARALKQKVSNTMVRLKERAHAEDEPSRRSR